MKDWPKEEFDYPICMNCAPIKYYPRSGMSWNHSCIRCDPDAWDGKQVLAHIGPTWHRDENGEWHSKLYQANSTQKTASVSDPTL